MNEFVYWAFCSVGGQNEEHRSFVKIFGGFQSAFIDLLPTFTKHLPRSCHHVKFRILRFFFNPTKKKYGGERWDPALFQQTNTQMQDSSSWEWFCSSKKQRKNVDGMQKTRPSFCTWWVLFIMDMLIGNQNAVFDDHTLFSTRIHWLLELLVKLEVGTMI